MWWWTDGNYETEAKAPGPEAIWCGNYTDVVLTINMREALMLMDQGGGGGLVCVFLCERLPSIFNPLLESYFGSSF